MLGDDLGVNPLQAQLYCDNESTNTLSRNPISLDRSRHIAVKYRKVQELIAKQVMSVEWIPTKDQVAGTLTKATPRVQFRRGPGADVPACGGRAANSGRDTDYEHSDQQVLYSLLPKPFA
jgi:hypothetical protein